MSSLQPTPTMVYSYVSACTAVVLGLLLFAQRKPSSSAAANSTHTAASNSFRQFQWRFLTVYLVMTAADWAQGPYVYNLYEHYGFSIAQNGQLFIAGFGASLTLGTIAGSLADKRGRKFGAVLYGLLYMASCVTKHFNSFPVLIVGRVLGGIATSLLFSVFEAWMVAEHEKAGFDSTWLASTFAYMSVGNGIVAILAGWAAQAAVDLAGHPVAPFDFSFALLAVGTVAVWSTWGENFGQAGSDLQSNLADAWRAIRTDRSVLLLGTLQSLFEGAMYTFVFIWTPALQEGATTSLPLGTIFATFMICCAIGGALFKWVSSSGGAAVDMRSVLFGVFLCATVSLAVPAITTATHARFAAFLLYEVAVGVFWPGMGTLRAACVDERVRATILNLFRVPLNVMVCVILLYVGQLAISTVCLLLAATQAGCCALIWMMPAGTSNRSPPSTSQAHAQDKV
ncbi:hypothetical protein PTSG_02768 [Salpingoeca rosetta]|uniref:Molybdate-anion transporter n=1 Tax=Salpingoeca rosetta (strain ATCC 50818 / BSB-021) TaxID=946362 RepID=F2U394_SALR5|nr:uncharacterized protein PTSG_02768 [Salpingoeca rosetta]EGD82088.1 hypothetical protein PTSG_02768 [Salpingoeca rosetta]|eukprot:XP_004996271.1 hypothetical protein PTSG_02768 [Salpingoeca rosetta]